MRWTSERPSIDGFYLARVNSADKDIEIVRVKNSTIFANGMWQNVIFVTGEEEGYLHEQFLQERGGEWCGPLNVAQIAGGYAWRDTPPTEEGDFFYSGPTPEGREILAIVQVFNVKGDWQACVFLPPNWRGMGGEAILHHGKIADWKGKWSGPEYGLCCVEG